MIQDKSIVGHDFCVLHALQSFQPSSSTCCQFYVCPCALRQLSSNLLCQARFRFWPFTLIAAMLCRPDRNNLHSSTSLQSLGTRLVLQHKSKMLMQTGPGTK